MCSRPDFFDNLDSFQIGKSLNMSPGKDQSCQLWNRHGKPQTHEQISGIICLIIIFSGLLWHTSPPRTCTVRKAQWSLILSGLRSKGLDSTNLCEFPCLIFPTSSRESPRRLDRQIAIPLRVWNVVLELWYYNISLIDIFARRLGYQVAFTEYLQILQLRTSSIGNSWDIFGRLVVISHSHDTSGRKQSGISHPFSLFNRGVLAHQRRGLFINFISTSSSSSRWNTAVLEADIARRIPVHLCPILQC